MQINKDQKYIVRTNRAGVFYGNIAEVDKDSATMTNVRKVFYWDGSCAVEDLAQNGTVKPRNCKLTVTIEEMQIADPIQIIPCTNKAIASLDGVAVWKA